MFPRDIRFQIDRPITNGWCNQKRFPNKGLWRLWCLIIWTNVINFSVIFLWRKTNSSIERLHNLDGMLFTCHMLIRVMYILTYDFGALNFVWEEHREHEGEGRKINRKSRDRKTTHGLDKRTNRNNRRNERNGFYRYWYTHMWTDDSGRTIGRKLTCAREDCDGYNNTKSTGSRRRRRLRDRTVHRTLLHPPPTVAPRDRYRIRGRRRRRRRRRWLHVGDFFFHFLFLNAERVTSIGIPRFVISVNIYERIRRTTSVT